MSREIGNEAEARAVGYLEKHGYTILDRNFTCRVGEIDIIAKKDGHISFVEVKYRKPMGYGGAVDAITPSKMRKILLTAKIYLMKSNNLEADYQIDAVLIDGGNFEIMENIYVQGMGGI